MTPGTAEACTEELRRATAALDAVPALLTEARSGTAAAAATSKALKSLRGRTRLGGLRPLPELQAVRKDIATTRRHLRRPLLWRILWLRLRLFWQVARWVLLILLILGLLIAAVVWAARNRDWLIKQISVYTGFPAPPAGTAPPPQGGPPVAPSGSTATTPAAPPGMTGGGQP